ncbi:hypothetical protein [Nonomuraea salmonea]|uniref:hypothetical protein n=1 Tax=Nonomuraea salmonea TaxID=46181 RepID=UPI0031EEE6E4
MAVHVLAIFTVVQSWHATRHGGELGTRNGPAPAAERDQIADVMAITGNGVSLPTFQSIHDLG